MYARIKAAVARAEMERKGARQSSAQLQRAKQGRAPKGMRPLGYTVNGDVIPKEAEAVRAIYRLFARSDHPESLRSIARGLSGTEPIPGLSPRPKHSHRVPVERAQHRIAEGKEPRTVQPDAEWSPATILGILRNPRYAQMSTYTPKTAQSDGTRCRSWRTQILRDDAESPFVASGARLLTMRPGGAHRVSSMTLSVLPTLQGRSSANTSARGCIAAACAVPRSPAPLAGTAVSSTSCATRRARPSSRASCAAVPRSTPWSPASSPNG